MGPSIPGELRFVVPGPLSTLTGGFVYDRKILEGLRKLHVPVEVIELERPAPSPDERLALRALPGDMSVILDGLSLPYVADLLPELEARTFVLVHHPCCLEPGIEEPDRIAAAERAAFAAADGVLATSAHTASCLAALGVEPTEVEVVCPATDPKPLSAPPMNSRPRLLCVATLTQRKGHDLLLDAIDGMDVEIDLVGERSFEPEWAAKIDARIARGLGPATVRIHGALESPEVDALLDRSDLFVFPSRYEGFGMAPLEAVRKGVPVLATRVGALPEALPNDATCFVEPEVKALRAGLSFCLRGTTLTRLRNCARARAFGLPTWEGAASGFRDALRRLGAIH